MKHLGDKERKGDLNVKWKRKKMGLHKEKKKERFQKKRVWDMRKKEKKEKWWMNALNLAKRNMENKNKRWKKRILRKWAIINNIIYNNNNNNN